MPKEMNSRLSKGQAIAVLAWLPMHMLALPLMFFLFVQRGLLSNANGNLLIYIVGAVYMLLVLRRFFRRDFDPLWEHPICILLMVIGVYLLTLYAEYLVSLLLNVLSVTADNENNEAVIEMAKADLGRTTAMAVFLAPIVEESLFRAGIFGLLRRKNRFLAYTLSTLAFGLYHIWEGALFDPTQLVFILQYIPSGLALAFLYDSSDSIWSSIFLHMLINGVSILAVSSL